MVDRQTARKGTALDKILVEPQQKDSALLLTVPSMKRMMCVTGLAPAAGAPAGAAAGVPGAISAVIFPTHSSCSRLVEPQGKAVS
eukprot:SAG22_NODE_958_length_6301_cov_4.995324_5_plen_85_part_00